VQLQGLELLGYLLSSHLGDLFCKLLESGCGLGLGHVREEKLGKKVVARLCEMFDDAARGSFGLRLPNAIFLWGLTVAPHRVSTLTEHVIR